MRNPLERLVVRWLVWWHGVGEPHQYVFYRCEACGGIITWKTIRAGGCECDRGRHTLRPARLTWLEKARLVFAPWSI